MFQDKELNKLPSAFYASPIQFNSNHGKSYFISSKVCRVGDWSDQLPVFASSYAD